VIFTFGFPHLATENHQNHFFFEFLVLLLGEVFHLLKKTMSGTHLIIRQDSHFKADVH
jgi:hypothetical protein